MNLLDLSIFLESLSAVIFGVMTVVYARNALSTKASYSIGLFIFGLFLFVQTAGTAGFYFLLSGNIGDRVYPFMSAMGAAETAGAIALLRITL